jgi:REP element-mobilizing transposase RayT
LFGEILDGEMLLNEWGNVVEDCWNEVPSHFKHVELDAFVIMPNHVHGIIIIADYTHVGAGSPRPYNKNVSGTKHTLGQIVAYFKYQSSKRINLIRGTPGMRLWQRNYYEHIIRDEKDLDEIREYIVNNPIKWVLDDENPTNLK